MDDDDEELQGYMAAAVGGIVGAGLGAGAGYVAWSATGTPVATQEWFTVPGLVFGMLGGLVAGIYAHGWLVEQEEQAEATARRTPGPLP